MPPCLLLCDCREELNASASQLSSQCAHCRNEKRFFVCGTFCLPRTAINGTSTTTAIMLLRGYYFCSASLVSSALSIPTRSGDSATIERSCDQ